MRKHLIDTFALMVITGLTSIFFWKFFFPVPQLLVTPDFGRSDAWHFSFPTKYFLSQTLKQNTLPLWSGKLGGGFPLFAEGQTGTFFLPNLVLYKFLDPVMAYNLTLLLVPITIGWGMYVWLRLLNLSPLASLFGGVTMAFSGPVITQLPHITLLQGFSLLPWVMSATHMLAHKKSWCWIILLAVVISQQLFAGFPQASVITILFATGYFFWLTRKTIFSDCIRFGIVLLLALGLSAVQLLPSLEFLENSTARGGFSPQDAAYFSYPLKHAVTFINPFQLGNPKLGTYPSFSAFDGSIFWENTGFIGIIPLIFLVAFLFHKKKHPLWTFSLSALIVSFFLMLGSRSPLYIIYSFWPFNLFRVPSRFLWIFVISLISLSTIGLQLLISLARRDFARCLSILIIGFHVIFLMKTWEGYHAIQPAKNWLTAPPIIKFLTPTQNVYTIGSETAHNQSFLTRGWQDMRPYYVLRNALAPDANLLWNIASSQVYAGRFLRRQALVDTLLNQLIPVENNQATVSAQAKKFLDMFSVQQIVSTVPLTQEGLTTSGSITDGGITIQVYKNEQSLPRVYLARDTVVAQTWQEAIRKLQDETFHPGKSILVEKLMTLGSQGEGTVAIVSESDTNITVAVTKNPSRALLVLADTFYPGWKATIDEKSTEILPVNIRHRGVIVDPGNHTIIFQYTPQSLTVGARTSAATLLFIGAGFLLSFGVFRIRQKGFGRV